MRAPSPSARARRHVRRDLEELSARNLLRKVHGGAVPIPKTAAEPHFVHLEWSVRRLTPLQRKYVAQFFGKDVADTGKKVDGLTKDLKGLDGQKVKPDIDLQIDEAKKRLSTLTLLSGGEQALTAIALIFALFLTNPAPICVLD